MMVCPHKRLYETAHTWQTTCYVGKLTPYTTQNDLVPLFQNFGFVWFRDLKRGSIIKPIFKRESLFSV